MKEQRLLSLLAITLAIANGVIVFAIAVLFFVRPSALQGLAQVELLAGLGLLALLYFGSLFQVLRKTKLGLATFGLTLISASNLALVIAQTGGLDSPFYSLWLLVIAASGIFGSLFTIGAVALTIAAHLLAFAIHGFRASYIIGHLGSLVATVAAGALAEWIYYRGSIRRGDKSGSLRGQLGEEQLQASVLMRSMADGVIVVDTERRTQLINHATATMTGWDEVAVQNIDYRLVLNLKNAANKDITDFDDPFMEAWRKNANVVKNNMIMLTRAGKKYELSISISPIYNAEKKLTGAIGVFRDISHEKEVERQRNEFVSTASHEMRTPVAAIEGYIALAMNAKVATIDNRAMGYLEKAHQNTQHLGDLFRDLLSITKLEEGLIAKNMAPVNITKMLQEITSDMQLVASKKNLSVTFAASQAPAGKTIAPIYTVMADPERLREVIMNLVDNAIKYTAEGGITLGLSGDEKSVTVAVQDTGPGIPAEDISHLFQKFYRVDSTATRTVGGTGLGLYLCRSLIELFNGKIWVDSTVGKGSSFNFTLPRVPNQVEVTKTETVTEAPKSAAPVPIKIPTAVDGVRLPIQKAAPATVTSSSQAS